MFEKLIYWKIRTCQKPNLYDIFTWACKILIFLFLTERKRMSVIIEDSAGIIWLYCKGADASIFPLIVSGNVQEASAQVTDFSRVRLLQIQ